MIADEDDTEDRLSEFWPAEDKSRGANEFWFWHDKQEMEVGAARTVLEQAGIPFSDLRSCTPDPPDCEAIIDGTLAGIEVTELIDEKTLKATIKKNHQYLLWDKQELLRRLQDRIDRKDKVQKRPYGRYILVIVTDEFALSQPDVASFLNGSVFRASFITDAFLGLSYDPFTKSCPVFRLPLAGDCFC